MEGWRRTDGKTHEKLGNICEGSDFVYTLYSKAENGLKYDKQWISSACKGSTIHL